MTFLLQRCWPNKQPTLFMRRMLNRLHVLVQNRIMSTDRIFHRKRSMATVVVNSNINEMWIHGAAKEGWTA